MKISFRGYILLLLSSIVLLPLAFVGVQGYRFTKNVITEHSIEKVGRVALSKHETLSRELSEMNERTKNFLSSTVVECNLLAEFSQISEAEKCFFTVIRRFVKNEGAVGAILIHGQKKFNYFGSESDFTSYEMLQRGQLAKFNNASEISKRTNSQFYISSQNTEHKLKIFAVFPASRLQPIFDAPRDLGESGETFLADSKGFFISNPRYDSDQGHSSHPISGRPMKTCLSKISSQVLDLDYRNEPIIHGFEYIPEIGGGCIMAHITQKEAFAEVERVKNIFILVFCTFGLFLFGGIYYFTGRLNKSVVGSLEQLGKMLKKETKDSETKDSNEIQAVQIEKSDVSSSFQITEFTHFKTLVQKIGATSEGLNLEPGVAAEVDEKLKFLALISHEIRNPLAIISGKVEMLELTNLDEAQRSHLKSIVRTTTHLLTILSEILDLAKIQSAELKIVCHDFLVWDLLGDLDLLMTSKASQKGLKFSIESSISKSLIIHSDPVRIQQVLINLVDNAIKFTSKGVVKLVVKQVAEEKGDSKGENILFCVQDTGIGISAEDIQNIFRPYKQANPLVHRKFGGTGLGLSISQGIIRAMGSEIRVESEVGSGSQFYFQLPYCHRVTTI